MDLSANSPTCIFTALRTVAHMELFSTAIRLTAWQFLLVFCRSVLTKLFWCRPRVIRWPLELTMGIWWWRGGRTQLTPAQWLCALTQAKRLSKSCITKEIDGSWYRTIQHTSHY